MWFLGAWNYQKSAISGPWNFKKGGSEFQGPEITKYVSFQAPENWKMSMRYFMSLANQVIGRETLLLSPPYVNVDLIPITTHTHKSTPSTTKAFDIGISFCGSGHSLHLMIKKITNRNIWATEFTPMKLILLLSIGLDTNEINLVFIHGFWRQWNQPCFHPWVLTPMKLTLFSSTDFDTNENKSTQTCTQNNPV